jgi:mycofactocin glycosyltransferase
MRYRADKTLRRVRDGVLAGSPLVLLRLSAAGKAAIDRVLAGNDVTPDAFIERLVDIGAIHPVADPSVGPFTPSDVTVVIPARDESPVIDGLGGVHAVIVVDDGSRKPIPGAAVRHHVAQGPGAARNAGLALVTTPLVAFLDAGVAVAPGWLAMVLSHFADERTAIVTPRVRSTVGPRLLERYERARSPLDLGPVSGRVRARTRIGHVPSAVMVARVDVLRALGGFDATLRYGEDVDLAWRVDQTGARVRYEPSAEVTHRPRSSWSAWMRQRVSYGSAAAPLAKRHRGALAAVSVSTMSTAGWLASLSGVPVGAVASAPLAIGASAFKLRRKIPSLSATDALSLAVQGHIGAGQQLASAVRRTCWPLVALLSLRSRTARRALAASVLVTALDWRGDARRIDPVQYVALRALDDAAYGAGVWRGMLAHRTVAPLKPHFTEPWLRFPAGATGRPTRSAVDRPPSDPSVSR